MRLRSRIICIICDLFEEDNVNHLIMQCLNFQQDRNEMFDEIRDISNGIGTAFLDTSPIPCRSISLEGIGISWTLN